MRIRRLNKTERLISLLLLLGATACATWSRGQGNYGWPRGAVSCLTPVVLAKQGASLSSLSLDYLEGAFPGPIGIIGRDAVYIHPLRGAWFLVDPVGTAVNCAVGAAFAILFALLIPESRATLRKALAGDSNGGETRSP